ncbi:FIST signal transduction protein [Paraglaciecola sp.]|uniref:FIST signal transduction protein n=1 Tax=Paraglaciecola sp. TaxID=1920173 RepID=UPI003EF46262
MLNIFGTGKYLQDVSQASLSSMLETLQLEKPSGIFILCCDESYHQLDFFDAYLKTISSPVFGGVFPAIVYKGKTVKKGMVLIPVFMPIEVKLYPNLQTVTESELKFDFELNQYQSLMVLVDGLSRNIDYALNQIFLHYGQSIKVFGGGAGSLSFEQKPCLFSNHGMSADAMLIVAIQLDFNLAIGHGWEVLAGPFLANQVDDNRILQLNFQPALQVYQQVVEQHDGRLFGENEFFDIAKTYPFGIQRLDDDILVRDPVTSEGNALVCVGKIPENTMLYVLSGQSEHLIDAAVLAVKSTIKTTSDAQGVLFDCISRNLFLEEKFDTELEQISSTLGTESSLFGALVLGEIASGQSGAVHFHNKTAVVAVVTE